MRAKVRDTEIYFDIEGAGLVADGPRMREKPPAFIIHGGPGGDHTDLKTRFNALSDRMQLVYFDHRGQGRSARGDVAKYHIDENVEDMEALRLHLGLGRSSASARAMAAWSPWRMRRAIPKSVSHLVLCVTAAHAGFNARARQIVAERGTAEQKAVCDQLWAGELDTVEKLRHYYDVMGPLYSVKYNAAEAKAGRERGIMNPEALNRAFAPGRIPAELRSQA